MDRLFVLMGKSATGKDTIYKELKKSSRVSFHTIIPYTTRPMREGEQEGVEYYFVTEEQYREMKETGKVIEARDYNTVHGVWSYFMADDFQLEKDGDFLMINTLEGYAQICEHFGKEKVIPVYIQVEDGLRLSRALSREQQQEEPKYAELCRRFLADQEDFSEYKLEELNITKRYENVNMESCIREIVEDIAL